jgi:hypothetical protein
VGTPCNGNSRCEPGSFCDRDPNTGAFTQCTAQRPAGGACQSVAECDADSFCDFQSGQCRALGAEGEPCAPFGEFGCQEGLFCADPEYVGAGRCRAFAPLGAACKADWYLGCGTLGATCDPDSEQCVAAPGPGEPCPTSVCGLTSTCDWTTEVCVARSGEGEPCSYSSPLCAGALRCDGWDEARCVAPAIDSVCPVPAADQLPQGT